MGGNILLFFGGVNAYTCLYPCNVIIQPSSATPNYPIILLMKYHHCIGYLAICSDNFYEVGYVLSLNKEVKNMQIEMTADGSPTIYLPELDEHYHSVKGAHTESLHVYIKEGLLHRATLRNSTESKASCNNNESQTLRILEIGYGTGLNASLTAEVLAQHPDLMVEYFSLELYPLSLEVIEEYADKTNNIMMKRLAEAPWGQSQGITPNFTITKIHDNFLTTPLPTGIDVVYFDAFAPEKQPEMWSEENFRRIYEVMNPGGVLTTYCAKGAIRRMLASIGFTPERIPGPPAGKREILRAIK